MTFLKILVVLQCVSLLLLILIFLLLLCISGPLHWFKVAHSSVYQCIQYKVMKPHSQNSIYC